MPSVCILCLFLCLIGRIAQGSRVLRVDGVQTVLAVEHEEVIIRCEDDLPMSYCGFTHPTGTRFSFAGLDLNSGQCQIKVKVTKTDTGLWTCHIGKKDQAGEEITKTQLVRVTDKLAALKPNITVTHGKEVTLGCITSESMVPLSYCRFVPPKGKPFNINDGVTRNNSIFGKYYFPANKSLDRGDCAVTIKQVMTDDVGQWLCGAWLEKDKMEFADVIDLLQVEGTLSTASVSGITFGVLAIISILGVMGFAAWQKRTCFVTAEPAPAPAVEMEPLEGQRQVFPPPGESVVPEIKVISPSEPSTSPL